MINTNESSGPQTPPFSLPTRITAAGFIEFLNISPDALLLINQAGKVVMVNKQTEALFDYSCEELVGQPLELLLPERFREVHTSHRAHYFSAPDTRPMGVGLPLFGRRKDGTEVPVDIGLRPLLLDDVPHVLGAIRDMTAQHVAEQVRLQHIQHIRLQTELINLARDAILVLDPISRVLSWNRGAEELYGWTAQQALGRITHTLLKTGFPTSRSALDACLEQDGLWEGELTQTCRDGRNVIVESRQVLVRDETGHPLAILEIDRDITERHRRMQVEYAVHMETATRLAFLQQVLDALPSSVYLVYGTEARLLLANRMVSQVWGADWQLDQPMLVFLSNNGIEIGDAQGRPLSPETFATLRAIQKSETVLHQQETIRHPDGTTLPVLVSAVPLTVPHGFHSPQRETVEPVIAGEQVALVVHQDVSPLKEADALKDEFIGIAAHELRTPLTVLSGYVEVLVAQTAQGHGPSLADWQNNALQEINLAIGDLNRLTEQLLDVTYLQAGRLHLQLCPTDVVSLVQGVAAHLQRTTTRHKVVVHTAHSELVAGIDARRVEQVVTNLIGNAIKYSPQGGPILISIKQEPATQMACISVQDRGIGISRQQHAQVFGRFMRAENAQAWGIRGTGLGLYLSRELVVQHGGNLWFDSEEGVGSTFFMTLPLVPVRGSPGEVTP